MKTPDQLMPEGEPHKPNSQPDSPTIHFHAPKLTGRQIVDSVQNNKPLWRTLQQTAIEDEATKRAKALSDRYDMTPIPRPEFDEEDWHL